MDDSFGNLDGHGEHGHFVSRDITDHFCATIGERISAMKSLPKAMEASFLGASVKYL